MRRWMLTTGLGAAAALIAMLVPDLQAALSSGPTPRPTPKPDPTPVQAHPSPSGPTGSLGLSARLDQGTLLAGSEDDRFLVITVTAPEPDGGRRMPVDVAVVMDTSGSMSGWHKIDYARLAARELVDSLRPGDRFSLVTFSDRARVLLPSQTVGDKQRILDTIDRIQEGGGTHMHGGITTGLEQLRSGEQGYVRRLLLLSDGHANVGISDPASLASLARQASIADVSTSTIGLGLDFNEDLLASMADAGGGSYHFVDQAPQLAEIFGEELDAMTRTVARDVTVRMDLPPGVRVVDTYGYTDSRDEQGWRVYLGDIYAGQDRGSARSRPGGARHRQPRRCHPGLPGSGPRAGHPPQPGPGRTGHPQPRASPGEPGSRDRGEGCASPGRGPGRSGSSRLPGPRSDPGRGQPAPDQRRAAARLGGAGGS